MTRIWRLEVGEDVYDIERYQIDEAKEGQLYPISGRILDGKECVDDIDVAEDDVLLYEPRARETRDNDGFLFAPK